MPNLVVKTCFKCGQCKPLALFYRHKAMADGHLNKCIDCTKSDVRKHRRENPDTVRAYDRMRAQHPHRVEMNTANTAAYRAAFPDRARANSAVSRAVRAGKLQRTPCWCCGLEKVEAHHPDYSRPLDVVWLCPAHHREIHLAHPE